MVLDKAERKFSNQRYCWCFLWNKIYVKKIARMIHKKRSKALIDFACIRFMYTCMLAQAYIYTYIYTYIQKCIHT